MDVTVSQGLITDDTLERSDLQGMPGHHHLVDDVAVDGYKPHFLCE